MNDPFSLPFAGPIFPSPAQRAVDPKRSLCTQPRFQGSWLWDAELDGGLVKNAKGESGQARAVRHEAAKSVCRACPERRACHDAALTDPMADGIYGGELIRNRTDPVGDDDGLLEDPRRAGLSA